MVIFATRRVQGKQNDVDEGPKSSKSIRKSQTLTPAGSGSSPAEPLGLLLWDGTHVPFVPFVPLGTRVHSTRSLTGEMLSSLSQDTFKSWADIPCALLQDLQLVLPILLQLSCSGSPVVVTTGDNEHHISTCLPSPKVYFWFVSGASFFSRQLRRISEVWKLKGCPWF